MAYKPTVWVDDETPVNAENLNKLELGVAEIHTAKENGELDGTPGKSAYQYALDGGYTGTEAEFARKLASESNAIHIGSEPPEDENVTVWIDTDEEPEASGGADWNASEGEPGHVLNRTHWEEVESETLFDGAIRVTAGGANLSPFNIEAGGHYQVILDGVTYECEAYCYYDEILVIGAPYDYDEEDYDYSVYPFVVYREVTWSDDDACKFAGEARGTHNLAVSKVVKTVHKLPEKYLPDIAKPYVIDLTESDEVTEPMGMYTITKISYDDFAQHWFNGGMLAVKLLVMDSYAFAYCAMAMFVPGAGFMVSFITGENSNLSLMFTDGTWTPPTT